MPIQKINLPLAVASEDLLSPELDNCVFPYLGVNPNVRVHVVVGNKKSKKQQRLRQQKRH